MGLTLGYCYSVFSIFVGIALLVVRFKDKPRYSNMASSFIIFRVFNRNFRPRGNFIQRAISKCVNMVTHQPRYLVYKSLLILNCLLEVVYKQATSVYSQISSYPANPRASGKIIVYESQY